MTGALFDLAPDRLFGRVPVQPCGCPVGEGHSCPPPWVDDWPETGADNESRTQDQVECGGKQTAPSGASTPAEGLTHDLIQQEGART